MAIIVEHEKRKHEILEKAFEVFLDEGYANATFQKIADRCNITRTTLYIYFKNKREIFLFSIKHLTEGLEANLAKTFSENNLSAVERLNITIDILIDNIDKNKKLFNVLLPYLIELRKSGVDPKKRVMRRIVRLRHILSGIIIQGQKNGEFKKIPVKEINDLLYSLIKAAVFNVVIFAEDSVEDVRRSMKLIINDFCVSGM